MTGEVSLRDVLQADLAAFFEHQADPIACRMAGFPSRDLPTFTAHWAKVMTDSTILKKTIISDGSVAGNVVSFQQGGQRLVGYWLGRHFWGKGIATAALSRFLIVERARPLYARVAKDNLASLRVLQKCGFATVAEDRLPPDEEGGPIDELLLELAQVPLA
jgi:RimJ/RimL family protein N-acetyltransferase